MKLSSECLVSYDPHFPGNDGTNKESGRETREWGRGIKGTDFWDKKTQIGILKPREK